MTKFKNILIAVIAITSLSATAYAGSFGVGGTGSLFNVSASGSEQEGGATDEINGKATASNNGYVGSLFAEYTFEGMGGITLGVDYVPGTADVNSSAIGRTDIQKSVEGTPAEVSTSLTRTAQAEIENHMTYYAEIPLMGSGFYAKGALVQLDVNTKENLGTPKYGNTSVDGALFGLGYKVNSDSNWYYKLEATHTEFDTINLTSTGNTANSTANKVSADLDVTKATFALGYKF